MATLLMSACNKDGPGIFNCEKASGPSVFKELIVDDIRGFKLDICADVLIRQGDIQFIEVEGQENVVDLIELDVQDGIWDIELDKCVKDLGDLNFNITLPAFEYMELLNSGNLKSLDIIEGDHIELKIKGSGEMDLELDVNSLKTKISGSGNMELGGFVDEMELKISGSGDIEAFDLECNFAEVEISGSGDVECTVFDDLEVDISGSGNVYYRGQPFLDISISGSGDVISAD